MKLALKMKSWNHEKEFPFVRFNAWSLFSSSQSFNSNWIKSQTCRSQPGPGFPRNLLMSIILIIIIQIFIIACSGHCCDYDHHHFTWSVRALVSLPNLLSNLVSNVLHITCTLCSAQTNMMIIWVKLSSSGDGNLYFGIMIIFVKWWSLCSCKRRFVMIFIYMLEMHYSITYFILTSNRVPPMLRITFGFSVLQIKINIIKILDRWKFAMYTISFTFFD